MLLPVSDGEVEDKVTHTHRHNPAASPTDPVPRRPSDSRPPLHTPPNQKPRLPGWAEGQGDTANEHHHSPPHLRAPSTLAVAHGGSFGPLSAALGRRRGNGAHAIVEPTRQRSPRPPHRDGLAPHGQKLLESPPALLSCGRFLAGPKSGPKRETMQAAPEWAVV